MNQIDECSAETSQEIALSIEETNKLRISLGLKPLDTGSGSSSAKTAEENYAQYKSDLAKQKQENELKGKIERFV